MYITLKRLEDVREQAERAKQECTEALRNAALAEAKAQKMEELAAGHAREAADWRGKSESATVEAAAYQVSRTDLIYQSLGMCITRNLIRGGGVSGRGRRARRGAARCTQAAGAREAQRGAAPRGSGEETLLLAHSCFPTCQLANSQQLAGPTGAGDGGAGGRGARDQCHVHGLPGGYQQRSALPEMPPPRLPAVHGRRRYRSVQGLHGRFIRGRARSIGCGSQHESAVCAAGGACDRQHRQQVRAPHAGHEISAVDYWCVCVRASEHAPYIDARSKCVLDLVLSDATRPPPMKCGKISVDIDRSVHRPICRSTVDGITKSKIG